MKDKKIVIRCPQCGCEYLPVEIYIPNCFFGKPRFLEKDITGKVINNYGTDMDLNEKYTCDKCNAKFKIKADVKFNSYLDEKSSNVYKIKLKQNPLFLNED